MFDTFSTYEYDLPLFQSLKLNPFKDVKSHSTYFVGNVSKIFKNGGSFSVDITVFGCPAQSWKFKIRSVEGKEFNISTGSGRLVDYWPSIELFASGMLSVQEA